MRFHGMGQCSFLLIQTFAVVVFVAASTAGQAPQSPSQQAATAGGALPPSEAQAKAALNRSPRHGEYVDIELAAGERPLRAWIVYPERKDKAPVVIVIHEIFGLSDWIRGVADQLAKDGFIAVAPDLVSGKGPGGGGTDSAASRDEVVKLVTSLPPAEVRSRLDATRQYASKLPASSGKTGTIGFCWGGGASFSYAAQVAPRTPMSRDAVQPAIQAAVVYYGTPPAEDVMSRIAGPVLGLYGGDDARVTSTVEPTKAAMAKLGKSYEAEIFPGAGHGFLRAQEDRNGANLKASEQAWPRTVAFLRRYLQ